MASIIRIKRSSVAGNPSTLAAGEIAYTALPDNGSNGGDRLYVGMGTETLGNAANHVVIGGKYFTDMLDQAPGVLTASSAIVVDANKKIDDLLIDNIELNTNTISTTNIDGNLYLTPNGTGRVVFTGSILTESSTFSVFNTTATTISAFGAATSLSIGAASGTLTIGNATITGTNATSLNLNGASPSITTTSTGIASVFNTNALTGNLFGSASAINIGNADYGKIATASSNLTISSGINATNSSITLAPQGTGTVSVSNKRITSVLDPTQAQDAATKAYVDAVKTGLTVKDAVRLATIGSLTVLYYNGIENNGVGATLTNNNSQAALLLDGIPTTVDDRVLIKDQTDSKQNGIYTVTNIGSVSTNWILTRAIDFDNANEVAGGDFVFVQEGNTIADNGYVVTTNGVISIGFTGITWVQFSGAGQVIAGAGLSKDGNTLNVGGTTDRITVNSDTVDIATSYIGQTSITTLGTVTIGTWSATTIAANKGGTGVANAVGSTITLGGALTTVGAFTTQLTVTNNTAVTLPLTGTLATLAGSEALSNKAITTSSFSGTTIAGSGLITFTDATDAGPLGTAAVVLTGGLSVAKQIYVGTNITGAGAATSTLDGFNIDGGTY